MATQRKPMREFVNNELIGAARFIASNFPDDEVAAAAVMRLLKAAHLNDDGRSPTAATSNLSDMVSGDLNATRKLFSHLMNSSLVDQAMQTVSDLYWDARAEAYAKGE